MSYEKPIKQCQDNAIGIGEVNRIAASQDAQKTLFDLEHEVMPDAPDFAPVHGNIGGGGTGLASLEMIGGEHDTPKIARGTIGLTIATAPTAGAPVATVRNRSGICIAFSRIATGQYFFPVPGNITSFYGEAHPLSADNTTYRRCEAVPSWALSNYVGPPGVFVSTWQQAALVGGALGFTLTDFSFDVTVYGNRGTDIDDSLPFDAAVTGAPQWVLRRRWHPRSRVFKPV